MRRAPGKHTRRARAAFREPDDEEATTVVAKPLKTFPRIYTTELAFSLHFYGIPPLSWEV
jgi:hypothetical protein